jgi:hypothetical protein
MVRQHEGGTGAVLYEMAAGSQFHSGGEMWNARMFPNEMFPNEETMSHDLTVDEASSTLRLTADLFEKSAAATSDKENREALLDHAKLYRDMAHLRDQSDAEVDDERM